MNRKNQLLAVLTLTLLACFTPDAQAVYNPQLGRWMQQDPLARDTTMQQRLGASALPNNAFVPKDNPAPTPGDGYHDGMNMYEYVRSMPVKWNDPTGEAVVVVVPLIVKGAAATAAAKKAAVIVAALYATIKCIRCKYENHGPHHPFTRPRWGLPPWKRCWMKHIQVVCWIKGKKGWNYKNRFPYGPCYRFKHANPPGVH